LTREIEQGLAACADALDGAIRSAPLGDRLVFRGRARVVLDGRAAVDLGQRRADRVGFGVLPFQRLADGENRTGRTGPSPSRRSS
jgi:hypothetical protein